MNPYEALGVGADANEATIKAAYRKKAREHHPDKGGAKEAFQAVATAYAVLSDPARRKQFDETGDVAEEPSEEQQVLSILASLVLQAVEGAHAVGQTDIIKAVRHSVERQIAGLQDQRKEMTKAITKRERAAKRLKRKSGGDNALARMIETDIAQRRTAIKNCDKNVELGRKVLEALADYRYEVDS